jgi:hypothetical protein
VKVPQKLKALRALNDEIVNDCAISRAKRIAEYQYWQNYYYSGTAEANPATYNKCFSHVDRLASYLFSPIDVRFSIEFDDTDDDGAIARAELSARYLTKQAKRTKCNLEFSQALNTALVKGKTFLKLMWTDDGLKPFTIQPENFGVYREDVADLDDQEAFLFSSWFHPEQIKRQLDGHPDEQAILKEVKSSMQSDTDETRPGNMVHQIVMGGMQPVATTPPATTQRGMVSVTGGPVPNISPEVARQLVRRDELWVWDDDREDWTTIVSIAGGGGGGVILEGKYKHRNLSGLKGEHPFIEICANPIDGYFWGRSELATLQPLQDTLNQRVDDMTRLLALRAAPPTAYLGLSGMTREKHRALMARNGFLSDSGMNGKIERLAPEMPPDLLQQVDAVLGYMDDVGGFSPIMQGQGDAGVRAGVHAQTLVRTGSPRIRDRALLVESQCEDMGDLAFKLLQAKQARVFETNEPDPNQRQKFTLSQMPSDAHVVVDSHSASPAFSEDAKSLAFALAKAGAVDGEGLLLLTQPPLQDTLIARYRKRAEAEAQARAANPQASKPGPKPKR